VTFSSIEINRVVGGKVEEHWVELDLLGLMQQLGALPESQQSEETSEGTGPHPNNLVNLNDTDLHLEEPWQDLRGLDVYDSNDDQIGSIKDVYVDREQRRARLLVVSSGGLLGVGKKHFLVPVQEVKRDLGGERITVEHPKEKVTESPEFNPDEGLKLDLQRAVYAYYGRSLPA
jgi:sporulation protein YlmC with PRC-barrel domain